MLTEEERFHHARAISDDHISALFFDNDNRLRDLENERRFRGLAVSVAIGAGPIIVGIVALFLG